MLVFVKYREVNVFGISVFYTDNIVCRAEKKDVGRKRRTDVRCILKRRGASRLVA